MTFCPRQFAVLSLGLGVLLGCAGCPPRQEGPEPYYGPTLPLWELAQKINANNAKIKTIWAQHDFDAVIVEPNGKTHSVSGNGRLLFRKPRDLLLTASASVVGPVFEVGSNAQDYWFTVLFPEENRTYYVGHRDPADDSAAAPPPQTQEAGRIPIRPDLLLEVLGVYEVDEDFMKPPVPVLRFNHDQDAYMVVWATPAPRPNRFAAVREVWYDRQTLQPWLVVLYDANGRALLRARLSEFETIEGTEAQVATRYDLFFPVTKSQLTFKLTTVLEKFAKNPRVSFPNDSSFVPQVPEGIKQVEIK